ncbi:DUF3800 domain-containing protein [Acetobacter orientalis]|uniref:DUF3800 domain-containing protein n=1 Tax=Acetobacter orientalis TaxID=146474 RepID=UPI0006620073|nr:DUF3800 domain-containing protein [Acetobacter orientalis]
MYQGKKSRYIFYVDEAGDDGLKPHSQGKSDSNSEWFVLGGIVIKVTDEGKLVHLINGAKDKAGLPFGRDLHFARLNNNKRSLICQELALGTFRWFTAVSHKDNMRGYKNDRAEVISEKRNTLYNWMLRLLLERVTKYCKNHNEACSLASRPTDISVVLSDRGGLRCPEFGNYFSRLWLQFQSGNTFLSKGLIDFSVFNPTNIAIAPNSELYGLQTADFIVSALYKALPQARQPNPSQEYLEKLILRCASLDGKIFGAGILALPFFWNRVLSGKNLQAFQSLEKLAASPRLCDPTTK